jgi:hypothetical protein
MLPLLASSMKRQFSNNLSGKKWSVSPHSMDHIGCSYELPCITEAILILNVSYDGEKTLAPTSVELSDSQSQYVYFCD